MSFYVYETQYEPKKRGGGMTWEELQELKAAHIVIENLAHTMYLPVEKLNEPYKSAYEKLGEVIERWETKP